MLTIKNIEKLFRRDVLDWRVGKVQTLHKAYAIHLHKQNGPKLIVNLDRDAHEMGNEYRYELWYWNVHSTYTVGMKFTKEQFETPEKFMDALYYILN